MQTRIVSRALAAEALGTLLLVATVVGSGIMAQRLTHDSALQLLSNSLATGANLFVLIAIFAPVSGAHFNPAVTLALTIRREVSPGKAILYMAAQIAGGIVGTWTAHAMFALPILEVGATARAGSGQWFAEGVATFGLVLTILATRQRGDLAVAVTVGLYIVAAYWFTASTAFANPAVTVARALTASFSGIRPMDVPPFAAVQYAGATAASICFSYIFSKKSGQSAEAPHQ